MKLPQKTLVGSFLLICGISYALPTHPMICEGDVQFRYENQLAEIDSGSFAELHWDDFSINGDETVRFLQKDVTSVVLNRVLSSNPSNLFGRLESNGQIILINPNGILVGKNASLDTGSFLASTLDLNSELFHKTGELEFLGNSENAVINEGSISATNGDIVLLARRIENHGSLEAHSGVVSLGAGVDVLISPNGTKQIFIKSSGASGFIDQSGSIQASRIEMQIDGNPYTLAFQHSGSIDALGVENRDGEIYLSVPTGDVFVSGTMSAQNGDVGGSIEILGQRIALNEGASLNVSGKTAGGRILVGGDYQGKNPEYQNAEMLFMDQKASIHADATEIGNGGTVILWSNDATRMYGDVSSRGGALGGNGGFVEVSGKTHLDYQGTVVTLAANGNAGTLLLDPLDLTIAGANAFVTGASPFTPTGGACAPGPGNATLSAATLTGPGGLGGGNVVVQTTGTVGACPGDIFITSVVSWANANSLTINSARDINVSASVQNTLVAGIAGPNRVILNAARNITINTAAVGSRDGGTSVICVGDLQMGTANSQIGFRIAAAATCFGSIAVNCNNLNMQSVTSSTQIGHGHMSAPLSDLITNGCNISVIAAGNITMTNGAGINQHCKIGHGTAQMNGSDHQNGNISITSGGNLTMTGVTSVSANTTIGHGPGFSNGGLPFTITGNIDIQLTNDLIMNAVNGGTTIGHGSIFTQTRLSQMTGNINLCCGRDAILTGNAHISHRTAGNADMPGDAITGDYNISIGRNLTLSNSTTAPGGGSASIGFVSAQIQPLSGTFNLSVCGNVTLLSPSLGNSLRLGYMSLEPLSTTSANIAIGGNLTGTNLTTGLRFASQGDFNLAVGGNLAISMAPGNFDGFISSGNTSGPPLPVVPATTRIYTGGSLTAASNGTSVLAIGIPPFLATTTSNLDIRAGRDIQWANTYPTAISGSININAGYSFAAGELWNGNATQLTSICNQPLAVPFNLLCGPCTAFQTASLPIFSACGGFSVQPSPMGPTVVNFSNGGSLTLTSQCFNCSGSQVSLLLGAGAANDITFTNPNPGAVAIGPFFNLDVNQLITTTAGAISLSACNNLNVNPGSNILSNGAGFPITLIADIDDDGVGNLNIAANVTSTAGNILLDAGFGPATGSSSINQTAGAISSTGGSVIAQAVSNVNFSGTSPITLNTGGGPLTVTSTAGTITVDENILTVGGNALFNAGVDILINPPGGTSVAGGSVTTIGGTLSLFANNNIIVNGDPVSLSSTTGAITVIADVDNSGFGNLIINQTISSTTGNICCASGPGTFGCDQNNCRSGLISGFPFGFCTVDINGGSITSATGTITITSAEDIIVNGLSPSVSTAGSIAMTAGLGDLTIFQQVISTADSITTFAGNNTSLTQGAGPILVSSVGELRMITGVDMIFNPNTAIASSGGQVTIVVDNIHPFQPVFPASVSGRIFMDKNTSINSGPGQSLRIFTAYSEVFGAGPGINFLDTEPALLNGISPALSGLGYPTSPGNDTAFEQWCTFFGCPNNYPAPNLGFPFTFFYKVCIQLLAQQATVVVDQLLVNFHPYNEFPGWEAKYWIKYNPDPVNGVVSSSLNSLSDEPYMIRRRQINLLNQPKTYTQLGIVQ